MTQKNSYKLTPNALEKLLRGDALDTDEPTLLQVHVCGDDNDDNNDGYLAVDGSNNAAIVRICSPRALRPKMFYIALVRGAVVSSVNAASSEPLLYISTFDVVEERPRFWTAPPTKMLKLPSGKTMGGKICDFLSGTSHFLSNGDLSGCSCPAFLPCDWSSKESIVSQFLEHDKAIKTIQKSAGLASELSSSTTAAFDVQSQCYVAAQTDFIASQLDLQKASLTSNTGREDGPTSVKIAEQHRLCLNAALEQDLAADLTPELLCQWHAILCGNGIHRHAGVLRPKGVNVRVGQMSFRSSDCIPKDLATVCRALMSLEARLLRNGDNSPRASSSKAQVPVSVAAVTFAAMVFFGIVDTHAFADGNGRLARVAANWALRRAGVPFCIHFFATPAQRKEYRDAVVLTRRNLYLKSLGHVEQETLLLTFRDAKCLQPLVLLFMDRLFRSVINFNVAVKEKSALLTDQAEAKAARMFRERAATGSCFICFDENPNIATLCCGKAVHLNCMAEWLSSKNSCPQCRGELPLLPPRLRPPDPDEDGDAETTDDSVETTDDTTSSLVASDDTSMDDTMSSTSADVQFVPVMASANAAAEEDASMTTTEDDDETTLIAPNAQMVDDSATSMTDDSTEQHAVPAPQAVDPNPPTYCTYGHCHNRSARDCNNESCGRCCIMHGRFACNRHNVA